MPRAEFRYCLDHVLFLHLERSQVDGKGKEKNKIFRKLLLSSFLSSHQSTKCDDLGSKNEFSYTSGVLIV
jgi:hypothetical protein